MQNTYTWYADPKSTLLPDVLHQILAYGTISDIRKLRENIGQTKLKELFLKNPKKIYSRPAINFIKKFILCSPQEIDENKYLKDTPRNIG